MAVPAMHHELLVVTKLFSSMCSMIWLMDGSQEMPSDFLVMCLWPPVREVRVRNLFLELLISVDVTKACDGYVPEPAKVVVQPSLLGVHRLKNVLQVRNVLWSRIELHL